MSSIRHISLLFRANIIALFIITSIFFTPILGNVYAETGFVPFVQSIPSNPSYPPSDIAWTGSQFIITTVKGGTLNMVSTEGKLSPFAPNCFKIGGVESHIAIAKPENYKFGVGNIYVSNGPLIWKIDSTGSKCTIFANLTNSLAPFLGPDTHTQVTFDMQGSFDNNLLVSTNDGSVWVIDHTGNFKLLASNIGKTFGSSIPECLDVAPTDFGPNSGKLIVGSQRAEKVYAISNDGNISIMKFQLPGFDTEFPTLDNEQCHFLPHYINITNPINGMYIARFTQTATGNNSSILKASADLFTPYAGSLIVTAENGVVASIGYNATSKRYVIEGFPTDFEKPSHGTHNKWEGFVFVNNIAQMSN
jgi:hypothetical protein